MFDFVEGSDPERLFSLLSIPIGFIFYGLNIAILIGLFSSGYTIYFWLIISIYLCHGCVSQPVLIYGIDDIRDIIFCNDREIYYYPTCCEIICICIKRLLCGCKNMIYIICWIITYPFLLITADSWSTIWIFQKCIIIPLYVVHCAIFLSFYDELNEWMLTTLIVSFVIFMLFQLIFVILGFYKYIIHISMKSLLLHLCYFFVFKQVLVIKIYLFMYFYFGINNLLFYVSLISLFISIFIFSSPFALCRYYLYFDENRYYFRQFPFLHRMIFDSNLRFYFYLNERELASIANHIFIVLHTANKIQEKINYDDNNNNVLINHFRKNQFEPSWLQTQYEFLNINDGKTKFEYIKQMIQYKNPFSTIGVKKKILFSISLFCKFFAYLFYPLYRISYEKNADLAITLLLILLIIYSSFIIFLSLFFYRVRYWIGFIPAIPSLDCRLENDTHKLWIIMKKHQVIWNCIENKDIGFVISSFFQYDPPCIDTESIHDIPTNDDPVDNNDNDAKIDDADIEHNTDNDDDPKIGDSAEFEIVVDNEEDS